MKRLLTIIAAAGLLLLPAVAFAQTKTDGAEPPPISQTLVREGDFALDLAAALKLGEPATEAEAEDMLAAAGVSPKNGWIADYPITPDIMVELQDSVVSAAVKGNLPLEKEEAYKAFTELAKDYGLPVSGAADEKYAGKDEGLEYGNYSSARVGDGEDYYESTVIEDYYYANEPPVITYYTPPWDYFYLYSWVPYPFWWYGYYYPGYFILNDFTVVINVDHHHHRHHRNWSRLDGDAVTTAVVSNHFKDPATGEVERLSPNTRKAIRAERRERRSIDGQRAASTFTDVKAANSIVSRDAARARSRAERRAMQPDDGITRATRLGERVQNRAGSWGRGHEAVQGRPYVGTTRNAQRNEERATRLGDESRVWSNNRSNHSLSVPERATRLGGRSFDRPTPGYTGRSFSSPPVGARERSWSAPSVGGVDRSFSRPSVGGADRSFSRPSIGGGNRSFTRPSGGGGFNGGGFRGCRGGRC